jgi:hypothetical protein
MWELVDQYDFKQMDAGNNELYAVTMFNEVYRRMGLTTDDLVGNDWQEVKGWMQYVSTAEEGIVWAIDVEYDVWVLETGTISIADIILNEELGWTLVQGQKLVQLDTGFNGYVVGLGESGQAYWRNGITVAEPMGTGWANIDGAMGSDITMCGNGEIFMLTNQGGELFHRAGVKTYSASSLISLTAADRMGSSWEQDQAGTSFNHVSCGKNGQAWLVAQDMTVHRCDSQDAENPRCSSTFAVSMGGHLFMDIAVGQDGQVWGLDNDGKAIHRRGINRWELNGDSWSVVDADFVHIDVGDCQICGITPNHEIMCRQNVGTDANKEGDSWTQVRGQLMDISVGYGPVLWGVDYGHNVWFKQIGAIKQFGQDGWTEVDKPSGVAKMVNIDVGRDGHVWGVDDENKVYYRHGISPTTIRGTHWAEIPQSNFVDVAVCTDGHVWAVGADQKIYTRTMIVDDDQVGQAWAVVEDHVCENQVCQNTATQVTCGGGNVMILGANNRVYRRSQVTNDNPAGHGWENPAGLDVDNMWSQVTAGENNQVWMLHASDKNVYRYEGSSYQAVQPGRFKQINCGNWMLVGVTAYNEVYFRQNYAESTPNGDDWEQLSGSMAFVSTAEESIVWALDQSGSLWVLDGGDISVVSVIHNEDEGWTKVEDGKLVQVDVGRNGHLIGRFTDGLTYFRTGITTDAPMGAGWSQLANPG